MRNVWNLQFEYMCEKCKEVRCKTQKTEVQADVKSEVQRSRAGGAGRRENSSVSFWRGSGSWTRTCTELVGL